MADRVVPSHLYPLIRAFLATNGFSSTAAAFDKELGSNKVAKEADADLFEIYKEYVKAHPELVAPKRKAEDDAEKPSKKAKVEKEEKEDKKSKKSKKDESSDESSSDESDSDSDSDSSDESGSGSDSSSSSSSSSSDDSSSDSDSSDSESSSDSSSESESSDSSSDEKSKKKNKKDKKDKKEKKDKETNGKTTPVEPVVAVTPTGSGKKNAPFRRVTDEDASYLIEKFADNTFESKKGDGYGAKANEILSQVRGKGFRTEKNKKKKGTYRGGPIDLGINSIKYTYDD